MGDTIFNVSVRVDQDTMNMLDMIQQLEGKPRGKVCREAITDYLNGVAFTQSAAYQCYRDYCDARDAQRIISRASFVSNWRQTHKTSLVVSEGEKLP